MTVFTTDQRTIIGLVHLLPMPGTPHYQDGNVEAMADKLRSDVAALVEGGAHGALVQTVDNIYNTEDDAEYARVATSAVMASIAREIAPPEFHVGVQIMYNAVTPSLAAAKAARANFTRVSVLAGESPTPFGPVVGQPEKVALYRKRIEAKDVAVLSEVLGYHNRAITGPEDPALFEKAGMSLAAGANAFEVFHKDQAVNSAVCQALRHAFPKVPIVLGGGTDIENCDVRLVDADGALVGKCFEDDNWGGAISKERVRAYMDKVEAMPKRS